MKQLEIDRRKPAIRFERLAKTAAQFSTTALSQPLIGPVPTGVGLPAFV
ncbi:hypothetical protein [Sphingopyxis sp. Root1497]|nr:hypothetical protein [Sphingopyxis sp. Root1497]